MPTPDLENSPRSDPELDLSRHTIRSEKRKWFTPLLLLLSGSALVPGCVTAAGKRDTSLIPIDTKTGELLDGSISGYDCEGGSYTFKISHRRYEEYQERTRYLPAPRTPEIYRRFVTPREPLICEIAAALTKGAKTAEEKAQRLLDWVNVNIVYDDVEDAANCDYFRYPLETLYERTGDCEDTSFLYASLCKAAGLDVVLLDLPNHVAVGVAGSYSGECTPFGGKQYYFAETASSQNEKIGDIGDHKGKAVAVIKL